MDITNYILLKKEMIEELNGEAYLLEHEKTKARVLLVMNDDSNKVFQIGFRTPPADDTGVAHITEHSVLCGSRKFPVKDPFVELAKGSLNTFLNAMTYPDKTVYPVASVNHKDFHNLMDVYLDAVFYPNTYENDKILKQEGWHYELDSLDGELTYNGVVFNEMKGAYSSDEQMLLQAIQKSLFPDTTYGCDSGGDPVHIPELTQEAFLEFHRKYYHPSNSFIYLYGDLDFEKELAFIDQEYLSHFDYLEVDSEIKKQEAFEEAKEVHIKYPLSEAEELDHNTYLSYNVVLGDGLDRMKDLAFCMLDYSLIDVPGAPIRKALVDAGISDDVFSSYDGGTLQPTYSIVAKGCNLEDKDKFVSIIENVLSDLIHNGIDEKVLLGSLNHFEFKSKEGNYGRYPKGLMVGLGAFNSWLYDKNEPFMYMKFNKEYEQLKSLIGTEYYVNLLKNCILDNQHKTVVVSEPQKGLNQENEEKVRAKLTKLKASLSKEELQKIIDDTKELKIYQSTPSSKEDLEKLPMLALEDIEKKARKLKNEISEIAGVPFVKQNIFTNGIAYITYRFDLSHIDISLLPYVSLLVALYKEVDTKNYSYNALANEIDMKTGGIGFHIATVGLEEEKGSYKIDLCVNTKTLYDNVSEALSLMKEILYTSKITDRKRMKETIAELVSQMKVGIQESGHTAMSARALSYLSKSAYLKELTEGISFYEFVNDIYKNFDNRYEEVCMKLQDAIHAFSKLDNLVISYTGDKDISRDLIQSVAEMKEYMNRDVYDVVEQDINPAILNEGFQTAGKVQYVATAGNFLEHGYKYTGALSVLQVIFSYDYLWINVRVKGGAYGCMCSFLRTGNSYFVSYRDPNLEKTYDVYKNAVKYVEDFEASERDMLKYIIGAIAKIDAPMTPSAEGAYNYLCYISGITDEDIQKNRDEILSADVETIRGLAPMIQSVIDSNIICALGNETIIAQKKDLFMTTRTLG
ncbi:MAG: insulinase family protein [Lachnospiraceae bacterium]